MKETLRYLFRPVLKPLESGKGEFSYKASHRKILVAVGVLFLLLALGSIYVAFKASIYGGLIPGAIFFATGVVACAVAALGSDRAVARLWRNR